MSAIDLWLDEDDVAAANASTQFTFTPPDDAVRRGNLDDPKDDKAKATWVQSLEIVESKVYEDKTKPGSGGGEVFDAITFEVKFQVPGDARRPSGVPDPNSGKTQTAWYRVVPAALKNKQHPKYGATNFALGKLNGILRSIWGSAVFPHGTKVNLSEFYAGQAGGPAPVVKQTVVANMRQNKYDGQKRDEFTDFVPAELRTA